MYKYLLTTASILTITQPVFADVCYNTDMKTALRAADILKKQKEAYKYCSICAMHTAEILKIKNLRADKGVYINGEHVDIAHVYYKDKGSFLNLGVMSGCIKDGQYNISAKLTALPSVTDAEDYRKLAETKAAGIYTDCSASADKRKLHNCRYD